MTPEEFVALMRSMIVEENTTIYKDLFKKLTPETATDPYWKRALTLYESLDSTNQTILLEIIKQTIADTTSDVLSVLDDGIAFKGAHQAFSLTTTENPIRLNGGLRDLFQAGED